MKTFEITYRHESNAYTRIRILVKADDRSRALIAGDREMAAAGYDGEWNPANITQVQNAQAVA